MTHDEFALRTCWIFQKQPSKAFLGKVVLNKICCKFTGEQRCWSMISIKLLQQIYRRTPIRKCDFNKVALQISIKLLLKSHFSKGVPLQICCTFSEHLFLRTPQMGCFWYSELYLPNQISCSIRPFLWF